jgi:endonuclease/exonuclease/phosphatase family metal-dependent hydrolase
MGWITAVRRPRLDKLVLFAFFVYAIYGMFMFSIPMTEETPEEVPDVRSAVMILGKERYVRVMTFNIHHAKGLDGRVNLDRIISDIRYGDPDIVALQEVDRFHIRSMFVDQVNEIKKALNMEAFFSPSMYYHGFAEYGNAILSKYALYNCEVILLPGIKEMRSLLSAKVKIGEVEVTLFTTHLGVLEEERAMQIPIILDKLQQTKGPAIFLGDLNMTNAHSLLGALIESWKKVPLVHDTGTFYKGAEIDHIFVGPYIEAINAWTIQTESSDHMPVVAELAIAVDAVEG